MEQLADQLINQNQYEEAFDLYQQCEQSSPILIKQAQLATKIGLFKQAINFYQLAYQKGEKRNELLIKIGKHQRIQAHKGNCKLKQATILRPSKLIYYNQILNVDENNPIAMGELGYTVVTFNFPLFLQNLVSLKCLTFDFTLYCKEDHVQAISQFTKCSKYISIVPKFLSKLGEELKSEYKYNTAKLYYLTAYQIKKDFKDSLFGLIDTCLKLEEYEQSLYTQIKQNKMTIFRSEVCTNFSDIPKLLTLSIQYCQILLQLDPNCIIANLRKLKLKILTNKIEEAEQVANQLDGVPLNYQTEYQLVDLKGLILFKKQQYLDCIAYLKDFIEQDQYQIKLIVTVAKCYYKLERYEEALNQLEMVFDVYQHYYPALQLQCKNTFFAQMRY